MTSLLAITKMVKIPKIGTRGLRKKVNHTFSGLFVVLLIFISGCEEDAPPTKIPFVFVDFTINLNLQEYIPLLTDGGYVLDNRGYKGIIIYRQSEDKYYAIERACTYNPTEPCEIVSVDQSGFFLIDKCCGSTFDFQGNPTGSPANQPLLLYDTYLDNNFLTISNNNR